MCNLYPVPLTLLTEFHHFDFSSYSLQGAEIPKHSEYSHSEPLWLCPVQEAGHWTGLGSGVAHTCWKKSYCLFASNETGQPLLHYIKMLVRPDQLSSTAVNQ